MRLGFAIAAVASIGTTCTAFAPAPRLSTAAHARAPPAVLSPVLRRRPSAVAALHMSAAVDAPSVVDATIAAAGSDGVALFGKSGCPFCKKAKAALYGIGVHATIVELDTVDGGAAIQKELEKRTGKATVPNVWLDGKFIGGSEEVLKGVEEGLFDKVEKGEIVIMEEAEKVPIKQGEGAIKAGDKLPSALVWSVFDNDPSTYIDLSTFAKDKSLLVIGLPGAFTPTCSGQQVPAYIEYQDKLKEAGIDNVLIYCVNDPAVMGAWAKDQGVEHWELSDDEGFVKFFADASSGFTAACGMEMTHEGPTGKGLLKRCKRYGMYIVDGVVKAVNVSEYEGDPAGDDYPELTLPPSMIKAIQES